LPVIFRHSLATPGKTERISGTRQTVPYEPRLPAVFLAEAAAAVGIAAINSIGNLGGFIGPLLVGSLVQTTGTTSAGLVAIGACLAFCGILTLKVQGQRQGN
jgi:nitrate/nitrite transporter NarK